MKLAGKIKKFVTAAVAGVCLLTLTSVISHADVLHSTHNLAYYSINYGPNGLTPDEKSKFQFDTDQVCVFCHTPHGANSAVREKTAQRSNGTLLNTGAAGGNPVYLWNRTLTNATSYTLYTSSSTNFYSGEVRVYSLMCLSCHDGVGALNVLFNPPAADSMADLGGSGDQIGDVPGLLGKPNINIGGRDPGADTGITKLSDDHPISIDYTGVSAGMVTPAAGSVGGLRLFPNPSGALTSLECSTCHDVHNQGTPEAGTFPFLAKSNQGSALCLTCHVK